MIRVESRGSHWFIDQDLHRYLRMPKQEVPRDPAWGLGHLKDLVWHDYVDWCIADKSFGMRDHEGTLYLYGPGTLVIQLSISPYRRVFAPDAHICDNSSMT